MFWSTRVPRRPARDCAEPRCPKRRTRGIHCDQHATQYDQRKRRATPWAGEYSTREWKRRRTQVLADQPTCVCTGSFELDGKTVTCKHDGACGAPSEHAHHVDPLRSNPTHSGPLEALCASCHGVRTHHEVLARMRTSRGA